MPEPLAAFDLQAFATASIDAARSAGATYADVRVAEQHMLSVAMGSPPVASDPKIQLASRFTYGVRVLVDGVWAFQHGATPSIDALTSSAQQAVATARSFRSLTSQRVELAPAPVVTGTWKTSIKIDPFTVPIEDQYGLLMACVDAAARIPGSGITYIRNSNGEGFKWKREIRVFASSEGSLVTQTLCSAEPDVAVTGFRGFSGTVDLAWPRSLIPKAAGYEAVLIPNLQEDFKAAAEEAVRLAALPRRTFDMGRYPVVFDGETMGTVLNKTIGAALEIDRIPDMGNRDVGETYLSPASAVLDSQQFSSLLQVQSSRSLPSVTAVQWDDEGVVPEPYDVIRNGRVVDYHTNREGAAFLRGQFQKHGDNSHGCAVAADAEQAVYVRSPHLTMTPASGTSSMEDMVRSVPRGLLVRYARGVSVTERLASGMLSARMYEISGGKIVGRVLDAGLQFVTRRLWKSLEGLGDVTTVRTTYLDESKGEPWTLTSQGATAPAGLFNDVDVMSTGRKL